MQSRTFTVFYLLIFIIIITFISSIHFFFFCITETVKGEFKVRWFRVYVTSVSICSILDISTLLFPVSLEGQI